MAEAQVVGDALEEGKGTVSKRKLSVVIPCFLSSEGFPDRIRELDAVLDGLKQSHSEIVLVADGPETASRPGFIAATHQSSRVRSVVHLRNYGEQSALRTGILHSTGDVIVTMDDDGQHNPRDIPQVIEAVVAGSSPLVYAIPRNEPHSALRGFLSRGGKRIVSALSGFPVGSVSSFRAFRGAYRNAFAEVRTRDVIVDSILLDHAPTPTVVFVDYQERAEGRSGYRFRTLLRHAVNLLFSFPSRPLRVVGAVGVLGILFGMVILGWTVVEALTVGGLPSGYPTLVGLVAVLSGIQLVGLGAIAEYLGRLYERGLRSEVMISSPDLDKKLT